MSKRPRHSFVDEKFLERLGRLALIAKRLAATGSGPRRSRRLGDGLEFADHRDYSEGDDIRFVDWPYYARMEKLLLRLFHEHGEGDVAILLDCSASMSPAGVLDKFNYSRAVCAALAYVAMASLERVVILPAGDDLGDAMRCGRNRSQILDVLDFLEKLHPAGRTNLPACVDHFSRRYPSAGTVLLISDLLDVRDDLSISLARLRYPSREVIVLHVYSPADAAPHLSGDMLLKASEGPQRAAMNITPELLESYRHAWQEYRRQCEHVCRARACTYVAAPTDLSFDRLILLALRKAGVLAD